MGELLDVGDPGVVLDYVGDAELVSDDVTGHNHA
jgi:hypothetical protein